MSNTSFKAVRLASILYYCCAASFILIPLVVASIWFFGDASFLESGEPAQYLVPLGVEVHGALSLKMRLAGFAVSMLPNALIMFGIWQLRSLFQCFRQLQFFTFDTTRHMKAFGLSVLLYAFAYPLAGGVLSLVLTVLKGEPGLVSITAGHHELMSLFVGAVMLAVASMMSEGKRISDEIEQFV